MKPGDLVVTVNGPDQNRMPEEYVGLYGVIVEPTVFEDGHPINSWCDWWVLIGDELLPWPKENLEVVNGSG
jgi:hypothetical protein